MKGILFTEAMFNAVVEGRKTQTRRIVKPNPICLQGRAGGKYIGNPVGEKGLIKPRYKVGEIVYLKEPFSFFETGSVKYKYGTKNNSFHWYSKLFMPEKCARYFIEITAVRCERLQDISDEDCLKEGIKYMGLSMRGQGFWSNGIEHIYPNPKQAYAALFDKINGKGAWESNPYVWVYDFKLLK